MNLLSSFKELATKQYQLTARERLMLIVGIGIVVLGITIYLSNSEVAVGPAVPNHNPPQTAMNPNKQTVSFGTSLVQINPTEQPIRDPFAKLPVGDIQKKDKEPASPVIHNNVSNTPPTIAAPNIAPSSTPQHDFKLTGIVSGADRCLAVIMSGGKSKAYDVNDVLGAYRISEINTDDVVLSNADDTKVVLHLESSGQKEGKISEK